MGRAPCCAKDGVKKGPWTPEEDQMLIDYINQHGQGNWRTLPKKAGLARCGKSCRLRWTNYLRPDIKRGRFSFEEEETIIYLHSILGNKWSAIAARLPGRTDNEIKNYWNTHIRKRLLRMGIDPVTHTPRLDLLDLSSLLTSSILANPAASEIDLLRSIASGLLSVQSQNFNMSFHQDLQQAQQLASVNPELQSLPISINISSGSVILEQFMQLANAGQVLPASQQMDPWPAGVMMQPNPYSENNYSAPVTSVHYENLNPSHSQQVAVDSRYNMYWTNSQLTSVLSTAAASPSIHLSSSTSTSKSSEDVRESGCSNLQFDFQIPHLLDMSNYI